MFDIGFGEILVVAVLGLLVLGPERLPEAVRTIALWVGRFKRAYRQVRTEIEREIGADEIRRQLQNEDVMHSLGSTRQEIQKITSNAASALQNKEIKDSLNASKQDLENIVNKAASAKTSSQLYAEAVESAPTPTIEKND